VIYITFSHMFHAGGFGSSGIIRSCSLKNEKARCFEAGLARSCGTEDGYTLKDEPQPQVDFTWGFSNLNPAASRVST
jgi:hypothetical protein